jgi:signal recognition particle GTPase
MEKGWVQVYTTDRMFQAEIFKQVLADHDIEAVILNKMDSSYRAFGGIVCKIR